MATVLAPALTTTPVQLVGVAPIVIDLGKKKKKRINDLKSGRGPLVHEVAQVINEVRANLGDDAGNKQLVPVVLIYRKKTRRRGKNRGGGRLSVSGGGNGGIFPFNFPFLLG
jgi:hypothetical protein